MSTTLRPYQAAAVQAARARIAASVRRLMINAPTGAGKTLLAAAIVKLAVEKNRRVLFLAHRRELVDQCCNKLQDAGILHYGTIMAGSKRLSADAPVQVASIQTLIRRELPPADIVIIDEAHRAVSRTYLSIMANYPRAVLLGLSATPERLDGKGLDELFDDMIVVETVPRLIEQGYLVKPVGYEGPKPDLSGVKIKRGDYDETQLAEAMDKPKLVGDLVSNWKRLAEGRLTVAFASSVDHAKHIASEFWAAGVPAAAVSGKTPKAEREAILNDWRKGYLKVVANCFVLTEGFDMPELSCAILARPTKSESLYLQMAGRVLRPFPGKSDALILDHGGCWAAHGGPHIERQWSLEGAAKRRKDQDPGTVDACDACGMLYDPEPKLWLGEVQESLRKSHAAQAAKLMRTKAGRALSSCPGCTAGKCKVCASTFQVHVAKTDIDGVAWTAQATCPQCHALYTDDIAHLVEDEENAGGGVPDTTNDDLVLASDAVPDGVKVRNEYKKLIGIARAKGLKRGWAYWRLREKYDEKLLRDELPRHTGNWWKAKA